MERLAEQNKSLAYMAKNTMRNHRAHQMSQQHDFQSDFELVSQLSPHHQKMIFPHSPSMSVNNVSRIPIPPKRNFEED